MEGLFGKGGAEQKLVGNPIENAPKIMQNERVGALIRLVTHLQAEGKNVLEAKMTLLNLQKKAQDAASTVQGASAAQTSEDLLRTSLEQHSEEISQILGYLSKNSEQIAVKAPDHSLEALLKLSKQELGYAYDTLINALDDRERAIEERLRKSVEHFGMEERILLEKKDFKRELEDIERVNVDPSTTPVEKVISVNQQIRNVIAEKNLTAEDKLLGLMRKTLNPFREKNFSDDALAATTSPEMEAKKKLRIPDPRIPKSL